MKTDDFLKDFPNMWTIFYNRPQLERELGEAPTEKLIKRLEEWIERNEKGEAKLKEKIPYHIPITNLKSKGKFHTLTKV